MSDTSSNSADNLLRQRQAYLLHRAAAAPEGRLAEAEAKAALKAVAGSVSVLAASEANAVIVQMVKNGSLAEERAAKKVIYAITQFGRLELGKLDELELSAPPLPVKRAVNAPVSEEMRADRAVFVLDALAAAPHRTILRADLDIVFESKSKLKSDKPAAEHPSIRRFGNQDCLKLTKGSTVAMLAQLAAGGEIRIARAGGSESYSLTPAGAERLRQLRRACPILPPSGKPSPISKKIDVKVQQAFLLLRLLEGEGHAMSGADAVSLNTKGMELNPARAWLRWRELAKAGNVEATWTGDGGRYELTPQGIRYLTTLPFGKLPQWKITGTALAELLTAARGSGTSVAAPAVDVPTAAAPPAGAQLQAAVLEIYHQMLRERLGVNRMVAIHLIRQEVLKRFGTVPASHAVLDELLLDLRRTDRVRLISVDDRSRKTPDQLRDSVSDVGETFFYVEVARESD